MIYTQTPTISFGLNNINMTNGCVLQISNNKQVWEVDISRSEYTYIHLSYFPVMHAPGFVSGCNICFAIPIVSRFKRYIHL